MNEEIENFDISTKLENLIEKTKLNLEDVKEHDADLCYIDVEEVEAIIEYLQQLQVIKEYREKER